MLNVLMFLGGLILLVLGASTLVRGASRLAMSFGISPLVVGLTIVALGTSAPEVAVSVGAVLDGKADIAIGNVVGSNIFNVLFILGISALITPLVVNIQLIRQEVPIMLGTSLLLLALSLDGQLSFLDGASCSPCWWSTPCSWLFNRAARPRLRGTNSPERIALPRPAHGTVTGQHRSA
jgi:cation:H+ antiporter